MKEQLCEIRINDEPPKPTTFEDLGYVQVVRCKNCKHWDKGHTEECDNTDSVCFHNGWCKPDWFCADGEKKQ